MFYPSNFETKIGFEKIKTLLLEGCLSGLGKSFVESMSFSTDVHFIEQELLKTKELKAILQYEDEFPFVHFLDLRNALKRILPSGTHISREELFDLLRSLQTIYAIVKFLDNKKEEYPNLNSLTGNIVIHKNLIQACQRIIDETGHIKDNASKELLSIRQTISQKKNAVARVMQKVLKSCKTDGLISNDTELSVRDGRLVIPIISYHKRKIQGIVLDQSASGKTSFIEPTEAFEINNEINKLEFEERREIIKVLTAFTDEIRPINTDLQESYYFLGTIDFLRTKGSLAIRLDATLPIITQHKSVNYIDARHPLLILSFKSSNKMVIPLCLDLNKEQRILVISGPNAGGKSVCLKSIGLLQYMLQCGLLIPVDERSEIGVFNNIFIDIGDEQSIENDLSTYSSHLLNMKFFLQNADKNTLILIDEFGTGTEQMLGGAIAEAVLEQLIKESCFGIITTHYTYIKHFATQTNGIVNGAMLYDNANMQPLYRLSIGNPGSSFAFEIAQSIGLPHALLENAKNKIGLEHVDFDNNLKDIEKEKQTLERKIIEIESKEEKLRQNLVKYEEKLKEVNLKKKEILQEAHKQAEMLIFNANKEIEKTIKEIKESQAEQQKTKTVRKNLDDFKVQMSENKDSEENRINKKIERIKQKQEYRAKKQEDREKEFRDKAREIVFGSTDKKIEKEKEIKETTVEVLKSGDAVCVKEKNTYGEIVEIAGKHAIVAFGVMKSKILLENLEKAKSKPENKKKASSASNTLYDTIYQKKLHFKAELDTRGQRADDALMNVKDFVEQAIVLDIKQIQILHGKGDGILRKIIRDYLKTIDLIKAFGDAHIEFGGDGITIIEIE
ncbi:MAG: Smr/MutS family protein [Bacteroidales bacterium]|nr:Smr/MutS family protein [Bacteroidales bacterium]